MPASAVFWLLYHFYYNVTINSVTGNDSASPSRILSHQVRRRKGWGPDLFTLIYSSSRISEFTKIPMISYCYAMHLYKLYIICVILTSYQLIWKIIEMSELFSAVDKYSTSSRECDGLNR